MERLILQIMWMMLIAAFSFNGYALTRPEEHTEGADYPSFEKAEGWFEADGLQYRIIEGTTTCEVNDYSKYEFPPSDTGRYQGDVDIPAKVTYDGTEYDVVGICAMEYCDRLRSVKIPSSVRYIDGFRGNKMIRSINIPEGVERISGFSVCMGLTDLELPASLKEMDNGTVSYYPSLERLTVHGREPLEVDEFTFFECNQEVCTLIVPEGTVDAYSKAPGWRNFGKITDSPEPRYLTGNEEVIHAGTFDYVITTEDEYDGECALVDNHDYDADYWYFYDGDHIRVPWGMTLNYKEYLVTAIVAFRWSTLNSVEIPISVKYIDGFKSIRGLESLTIPHTVTTVKGITHCKGLREIVLPEMPVDITMAIYDCSDLQRVVVKCPEPYGLGKGTFMGCNKENCTLVVPDGSVEAYKAAPGWKDFGEIISETQAGMTLPRMADNRYLLEITPGRLHIEAYEGTVSVFSIEGRSVTSVRPGSDCTIDVASGIYLVNDGKKTEKIFVP